MGNIKKKNLVLLLFFFFSSTCSKEFKWSPSEAPLSSSHDHHDMIKNSYFLLMTTATKTRTLKLKNSKGSSNNWNRKRTYSAMLPKGYVPHSGTHKYKITIPFSEKNQFSVKSEKMSQQLIDSHREKAEVYTDPVVCKQKSLELLKEINMPNGLLPLEDIVEVGRNAETGFVWLKQKKAKEHKYKKIGRLVWYDTEVTAFVENHRMKKLTGVKSKELLTWDTISEISISDPEGKKINFGTPTGLSKSFPISAFEEEKK